MNKPLAFLLRALGFNRPSPKNHLGRILRRGEARQALQTHKPR